jgi:hypothetical protein
MANSLASAKSEINKTGGLPEQCCALAAPEYGASGFDNMASNHFTDLRAAKIPLKSGTGSIPALGFGTLIPDPAETRIATTNALKVGFRHFDCAERYRNEREVGEALRAEIATGALSREEVFITTKLWNTNHRP